MLMFLTSAWTVCNSRQENKKRLQKRIGRGTCKQRDKVRFFLNVFVHNSLFQLSPKTSYYFLPFLARVVREDNAIHRMNHYPENSVVCFVNAYSLDSDLSGG